MPAQTPEQVHEIFARNFSSGKIDEVVALYESDATLMPQPGQSVTGHAPIKMALSAFLALQGEFKMAKPAVLRAGDVALLYAHWTLTAKGPDGSAINLSGQTSDVVRRQADGSWKYIIDNPYGGAAFPA